MVDLLSWAGMVLVVGAVWFWSRGQTMYGNICGLISTTPWFAVGMMTGNYALVLMQVVLAGNAIYGIRKEKNAKLVYDRLVEEQGTSNIGGNRCPFT